MQDARHRWLPARLFTRILLLLVLPLTCGVVTAAAQSVHINEVESNGGAPDDWIELTNTGASTADISGWKLLDNDNTHNFYVFPSGSTITPGGFLTVDIAPFFGLGAADSVRLYDLSAALPTAAPYETFSWTAHAATTYGRCPNGTGAFTTTVAGTKNAANSCPVRLNEVESSGGTPDDWFELYNAGTTTVDVSGWSMKDNDDSHAFFFFPAGSTIAPGGYLVFDNAPPSPKAFPFGLGSPDSVRIYDATGALYETFSWTTAASGTYGRCPNGTGPFTTNTISTKGAPNNCGGGVPASPVKITEVESTGGVPGDWIELYNPTAAATSIGNFLLKDNDDGHIFVIPAGTMLAPGSYLAFDVDVPGGFGLGDVDSARLFDTTGTLVDSTSWTAHAATTYGRCPDGLGAFTTTLSPTKGAANACRIFTTWPGGAGVQTSDGSNVFGGNMSGLVYEGALFPPVLWAARNGPGSLFRLIFNGSIWTPDTANNWSAGKLLLYPGGGTASPDSEGVTFAGTSSNGGLYVAVERDNNNNGVSRNSILRFDPLMAGATLTATHEWNLTADLPATGPNLGAEAITWIPDSFLTANNFFDASKNHIYDPAEYVGHGTGLFFVGLEANGEIYAYALDHGGSQSFTRIATISTGLAGVMDLQFDSLLSDFWAICDDTCQGNSVVLRIDGTGKFVVAGAFQRPAGMPNFNNEGFAITPGSECVSGFRPVFWADDTEDNGHAIRSGSLSCSPIVNFADSIAPKASPVASPLPNGAGWNTGDVTINWNWTDNPGGSGIDSTNCAAITVSSGEGTLLINGTCKDLAGNIGNASFTVKVDKTAPSLSITSPAANSSYSSSAQLQIDWTASDSVSGLALQSATLDGKPLTKGQVVDLLFESLGTHIVVANASDNAGNTATASASFTVVADTDSIAASIDRLLALGAITNAGIANSLKAKLDGNPNQLNAFLNELDAQRGKKINQQAYDLLRAAVLYVIAHP